MNSREEIAKKYFPCTCGEIYLSRNLTAPDCPFHAFDWDGAFEEYAQQSQPSGMSAEEVKEIAENHFKNTTWLEGTQEQDTKFGFRIGYMKAMKDFTIQNPSTASPAGAAEGASEGMAGALRLLDTASNLVGNPGTNISSSTDLACDSWQEKYKKFLASISPGVEDNQTKKQ